MDQEDLELSQRRPILSHVKYKTQMPLPDIEEFHKMVIESKSKRVPIRKTLMDNGVPKSTYYRLLDMYGEVKWRELYRGRTVTKPKKQKINEMLAHINKPEIQRRGLQGGNLADPKTNQVKFSGDLDKIKSRILVNKKKSRELDIKLNGR